MSHYNFTESEWETCIKVLSALKDDPMQNPDNQTFKSLIKKIYKKARKIEHHQALQEKEKEMERLKEAPKEKEQPGIMKQITGYFGF